MTRWRRVCLIRLPEKAGIGEAGPQYDFVAVPDQSIGVASGIEHGEEMRSHLFSSRPRYVNVSGDRASPVTNTSSGKSKNSRIKAAKGNRRKFSEIDYGRDPRLVFAPQYTGGECASSSIKRFAEGLLALAM